MRQIDSLSVRNAGRDSLDSADGDEGVVPLTASEAQALRKLHPSLSPWVVLVGQVGAGTITAVVAGLLTGLASVGWSALYGAAAVVIPSALFARGLMSKVSLINPASAVTGFFLWEMVKIGLVLAMLYVAPKLVADLSWPAMLVGLVVTMKAVWLVIWFEAKTRRKPKVLNVSNLMSSKKEI